ncbi:MAG: hypothetical protein QOJ29_801 [Thermoleophilaceae bacterium]|nr:hypothetical protein [Thermoleophilaceae bacterium]
MLTPLTLALARLVVGPTADLGEHALAIFGQLQRGIIRRRLTGETSPRARFRVLLPVVRFKLVHIHNNAARTADVTSNDPELRPFIAEVATTGRL